MLASILIGLALVVFIEGLINPPKIALPQGVRFYMLLITLGLLAVAPTMMYWLGFRIAGIVLALTVMGLLTNWRELSAVASIKTMFVIAAVAVVATLALQYVFTEIAGVPLPRPRIF